MRETVDAMERALNTTDADVRATAEDDYAENSGQTADRFAQYEDVALHEGDEEMRWEQFYAARTAWTEAAEALMDSTSLGATPDDAALAQERDKFEAMRDIIDGIGADIYENEIPDTTATVSHTADSQTTRMLIALVVAG